MLKARESTNRLGIRQGRVFSIMSSLARFICLHHLKVRFDMSATNIWQLIIPISIFIAKSLFALTRQEIIGALLLTMDLTV